MSVPNYRDLKIIVVENRQDIRGEIIQLSPKAVFPNQDSFTVFAHFTRFTTKFSTLRQYLTGCRLSTLFSAKECNLYNIFCRQILLLLYFCICIFLLPTAAHRKHAKHTKHAIRLTVFHHSFTAKICRHLRSYAMIENNRFDTSITYGHLHYIPST